MSEAIGLKPCPFCGEEDEWDRVPGYKGLEVWDNGNNLENSVAVHCRTCEIQGPREISPQFAIKKWNKRSRV